MAARWKIIAERKKLSSKGPLAKAIDYQFNHWAAFTRFLDDGRVCLSNNAAERSVRDITVGRRNWTFCGSDTSGHRAAVMYTLIESAKLCDVDPKAWLADVLARIADHPAQKIDALLPLELESRPRARGCVSGGVIRLDHLRALPDAHVVGMSVSASSGLRPRHLVGKWDRVKRTVLVHLANVLYRDWRSRSDRSRCTSSLC